MLSSRHPGELSRGGRRKDDVIDAAAAASLAALAGDATPVVVEDSSTVSALLDERRANLATHRTRLVNQLHALLRDRVPGGVDPDLTAAGAARALARVRPVGPAEAARKQMGRDLIAEVREVDAPAGQAVRADVDDDRRVR
jgi:transposase